MFDKNTNYQRLAPLALILFFFLILPLLGKIGEWVLPLLITLFIAGVFDMKTIRKLFPRGVKSQGTDGGGDNIYDYQDINKKNFFMNQQNFKKIIFSGIALVLGLWLFFASIVIVGAGETGVYALFGRVDDNELKSGFHLVIPLAHVEKMSIQTEEYTMSIVQGEGKRANDDSITALTKEGLSVSLDLTTLYRLNESSASDVYKNVGVNYSEKIIRPTIRTAIRDVVASYDAKEMYSSKREEAASKIKDRINQELEARGVILEDVLLRDVRLPENLAKSIQEKLQAEQEAQRYDFLLDREKKEKTRKIIEAEGQRDSQKIINESLTPNYLYYSYINQLKDRQGTIYVPTSPTTGMPVFKELGK